jgi:hypothetical protein
MGEKKLIHFYFSKISDLEYYDFCRGKNEYNFLVKDYFHKFI